MNTTGLSDCNGWKDEEFVCCEKQMNTTGLSDCNGWKCETCGHEHADIASMKIS